MNTPVSVLLARKGQDVHSIDSSARVIEAVRLMNERRVGSVVILEGGRLAGIFTERDVLSRVVAVGLDPIATPVSAVMTGGLHTIAPETTLGETMEIFTNKRCRHLPVLEQGQLIGLISIGDVSRWLSEAHRAEAEQLRQYIAGGFPG